MVNSIGGEPCKPVHDLTVAPSARLWSSRERLALPGLIFFGGFSMYHVTTRLEVNVFSRSIGDIDGLTSFVVKHRIPTIVVDPALLEVLIVERSQFNYAHKIICAIDFENKYFSFNKMKDLGKSIWAADGYEILVSPNRTDIETMNEMKSLREFILAYEPTKEIRWALNLRNKKYDFSHALKHAKNIPGSFIRTDTNLISPASTMEAHKEDVDVIKKVVAMPIKISGSVNYDLIMAMRPNVARFDVTLSQAREIVIGVQKAGREEELQKIEDRDVRLKELEAKEAKKVKKPGVKK